MGQLGLGDTHNRRAPSVVEGLWAMPVHQLAAGDQHSAALTASGFLFTWGSNDKGQLGLPARAEQAVQVLPFLTCVQSASRQILGTGDLAT